MKVCVFGLWHLGSVTAACLADAGITTVGLDHDVAGATRLAGGQPPLFEPGLQELIRAGLAGGKLSFTADKSVVTQADLVWVTFDTPVDEDDSADVEFVVARIQDLFPYLRDGSVVLVSSQLPVGTIADLERRFAAVANGRQVAFACSPENLRLGKAIDVFRHPERVIVGTRGGAESPLIARVFAPFSNNIIWMGTEAAELTKHAINAFLATCVTFINEIATLCERVGANARDVERGLRSEPRIGPKAYIRPGAAFAGGTLARDVTFLGKIAEREDLPLDMIGSILKSNRFHRDWPIRKLTELFANLSGVRVAILGLAYKADTDATRRSLAVEMCHWLSARGATVAAFDPAVRSLPDAPANVTLAPSTAVALSEADVLILMTEWADFKTLTADDLIKSMARPTVLDQNGFLAHLAWDSRITYLTVGTPK